jgi:hypothetical protein
VADAPSSSAWHCQRLGVLGVVCEREELLAHVVGLREALTTIAEHAEDDGIIHYAKEALDAHI